MHVKFFFILLGCHQVHILPLVLSFCPFLLFLFPSVQFTLIQRANEQSSSCEMQAMTNINERQEIITAQGEL